MRKVSLLLAVTLFCCTQSLQAQVQLGPETTVVFASAAEGKKILTERDDFVKELSPFDRSVRMKTDKAVTEKQFLDFVGKNVLSWSDTDKQAVEAALLDLKPKLEKFSLQFPKTIFMIETTGEEEGGAAYTRANAIVLTKGQLTRTPETLGGLSGLICHELFHVLSRTNPELRERLYETIGFVKCDDLRFPPTLKPRKITNPDAPRNNHCIRLQIDDKPTWAIPILFSAREYDAVHAGGIFDYLQFKFVAVQRDEDTQEVKVINKDAQPVLAGLQQISGFMEQVGKNTTYLIHPEEILAENFRLLVTGSGEVASPQILDKMRDVLAKPKKPEPQSATEAVNPSR